MNPICLLKRSGVVDDSNELMGLSLKNGLI